MWLCVRTCVRQVLKTVVLDTHALLLSPSGIVDTVWHMALLMPKLYMELCHALMAARGQRPELIDHAPIFADAEARADRIAVTKALYKRVFREEPPEVYWWPTAGAASGGAARAGGAAGAGIVGVPSRAVVGLRPASAVPGAAPGGVLAGSAPRGGGGLAAGVIFGTQLERGVGGGVGAGGAGGGGVAPPLPSTLGQPEDPGAQLALKGLKGGLSPVKSVTVRRP